MIEIGACVRNILESPDFGPFEAGDIVFVTKKQESTCYVWCFSAFRQAYFPKGLAECEAYARIAAGARYRTGKWQHAGGDEWRLIPCRA
jgi:hypothetical protein